MKMDPNKYYARTTWDDTPERNEEEALARRRATYRAIGDIPGLVPAPHDESLAEIDTRLKLKKE